MQGRYWMLTIPAHDFIPYLPPQCTWIKGQMEVGGNSGYKHWQVMVGFEKKVRLAGVKKVFGDSCHCEVSRSEAADAYVYKDETAIVETRFEIGKKKLKRSSPKDWEEIRNLAKQGRFDEIPGDVVVHNYGNLKKIAVDHAKPEAIVREVYVFYGPTGVGKSRKAWNEAGIDAYPKDPRSKFWDGYNGQKNVVIDEFRGGIDISHMLRWLDRYPVLVEVKGSSVVLKAEKIYITSNLSVDEWYPGLDKGTLEALKRRLKVTYCPINLF